jgi:hypothetical protein
MVKEDLKLRKHTLQKCHLSTEYDKRIRLERCQQLLQRIEVHLKKNLFTAEQIYRLFDKKRLNP